MLKCISRLTARADVDNEDTQGIDASDKALRHARIATG